MVLVFSQIGLCIWNCLNLTVNALVRQTIGLPLLLEAGKRCPIVVNVYRDLIGCEVSLLFAQFMMSSVPHNSEIYVACFLRVHKAILHYTC